MVGIAMSDGSKNEATYNDQVSEKFKGKGVLIIAGSAMSLVGTIMIIDSEKWLRRAYLGPDGIGVKFDF